MTTDPPRAPLDGVLEPLRQRSIPADAVARQRARFVASASAPARPGGRTLAAGGAALVAAAVLVAVLRPGPQAVSATLGGRAVRVGEWVTSTEGRHEALRFSDGSELRLSEGTHLRIAGLGPNGASVVVEDGAVDVRVRHRANTAWQLTAGPYRVDVTGTAFTLGWSPHDRGLDLRMREGVVIVRGPAMNDGIPLHAGASLHADVTEARAEVTHAEDVPRWSATVTATDAGSTLAARPMLRAHRDRATHTGAPSSQARVEPEAQTPDAAIEAAPTAAAPSAAAWMEEADRARLGGEVQRARTLLLDVRRSFSGTEQAERAAYLLGVLSLGELRSPAVAARYFALYLREAPGGPLASEARGRLVQALDAAGDRQGARDAAAQYLAHDPDGAFSPVARSLLAP